MLKQGCCLFIVLALSGFLYADPIPASAPDAAHPTTATLTTSANPAADPPSIPTQDPVFRNYNQSDGMRTTGIFDMHQDDQGFMWFATGHGVVRFDGYEFRVFTIAPQEGGVIRSVADHFVIDQEEKMWAGFNQSPYFAVYQEKTGQFEFHNAQRLGYSEQPISDLSLLGIGPGNRLWLVMTTQPDREQQLLQVDPSTLEIHRAISLQEIPGLEQPRIIYKNFAIHIYYHAFLTDSRGNVWIGTDQGALRIDPDGELITIPSEQPDGGGATASTGYSDADAPTQAATGTADGPAGESARAEETASRNINHFIEDDQQRIWIATEEGLMVKNPGSRSNTDAAGSESTASPEYSNSPANPTSPTDPNSPANQTSPTSPESPTTPEIPNELKTTPSYYLYKDQSGAIWITSETDTWRYKDGEFHSAARNYSSAGRDTPGSTFAGLQRPILLPQTEDDRYIWFANRHEQLSPNPQAAGFTIYDKELDQFKAYNENTGMPAGLSNPNIISRIYQSRDGSIWIAGQHEGLYHYSRTYRKFESHFNSPDVQERAGSDLMWRAYKSPEGAIFAGTSRGRILAADRTSGREWVFRELLEDTGGSSGFLQPINGLYWIGPGDLLAASNNTGLHRLRYDPDTFEIISESRWTPDHWDGNSPLNIISDRQGRIWIGTTNGIIHFDPEAESFRPAEQTVSDQPGLLDFFGLFVKKDRNGDLWYYGLMDGGVKRFSPDDESYTLFAPEEIRRNTSLQMSDASQILHHSDGTIYLAAFDGIYYLDDEQTFELLSPRLHTNFTSLKEDSEGNLVAGTFNAGLLWIDKEGNILKELNREHGLMVDNITDLFFDEDGYLWVMHERGLAKYGEEEDLLINYSYPHGLEAARSGNGYRLYLDEGGTAIPIWMESIAVTAFDPGELAINTHTERPAFSHIAVDGRPLPLISGGEGDEVILAFNHDRVEFEFTLNHFADPAGNQYRYRLEGIQEEFSAWSSDPRAEFSRLNPGSYRLQVEAMNFDRVRAPQMAVYSFTVTPPWYQSSLAYAFYLIFIAGFTFMAFRYYGHYRAQEQKKIEQLRAAEREKIRKKIAADFHDEIGNRITRLGLLIKRLEQEVPPDTEILGKMEENTQQLYSETRDFIWQMDPGKDTLYDIYAWLMGFGEEFFNESDLEFIAHPVIPGLDQVTFEMSAKSNILRCFKEAMTNAQKYSQGTTVELSIEKRSGNFVMSLEDDGQGMDPEEAVNEGRGLANMKERGRQAGGELMIDSKPGQGTRISFVYKG